MKKSRYSKMALAAILGVALIQAGPSLAKEKRSDEENLSVHEWGYWGTMGTPAAGPEVAAAITGPNVADVNFRDTPAQIAEVIPPAEPVPPPVPPPPVPPPPVPPPPPEPPPPPCTTCECLGTCPEPCTTCECLGTCPEPCTTCECLGTCPEPEPEMLGWSTNEYDESGGYAVLSDESGEGSIVLTRFTIPTFTPPTTSWADTGEGAVTATPFIVSAPILAHSTLAPNSDRYQQIKSLPMAGYSHDYSDSFYPALPAASEINSFDIFGDEYTDGGHHYSALWANVVILPSDLDLMVGEWDDGADGYGDGYGEVYSDEWNQGYFVHGTTTVAQDVLSVRNSGNVTIGYEGVTVRDGIPMTALVDFGSKTWSATFNSGRDDRGVWKNSWTGNLYGGHVGFYAGGSIINNPIQNATWWGADDGTIDPAKSKLEWAFFGNSGQALGGGYEIVKTLIDDSEVQSIPYVEGRHADVFVAVDESFLEPEMIGWATNHSFPDGGEESIALTYFGIPTMELAGDGTSGTVSNASFKVTEPILILAHSGFSEITSLTMDGIYGDSKLVTPHHPWAPSLGFLGEQQTHTDPQAGNDDPGPYSDLCAEIIVAPWDVDIKIGDWRDYTDTSFNEGYFVYGTTSTQAVLDNLHAGQVGIQYTGLTLENGTPMTALLNFADRSWTVSFNDGSDTDATLNIDPVTNNVTGRVGFYANGSMNGPMDDGPLMAEATGWGANDGTIQAESSTLEGAVFGSNGQVLAGGFEIVKTRNLVDTGNVDGDGRPIMIPGPYANAQHTDVFVAVEESRGKVPTK